MSPFAHSWSYCSSEPLPQSPQGGTGPVLPVPGPRRALAGQPMRGHGAQTVSTEKRESLGGTELLTPWSQQDKVWPGRDSRPDPPLLVAGPDGGRGRSDEPPWQALPGSPPAPAPVPGPSTGVSTVVRGCRHSLCLTPFAAEWRRPEKACDPARRALRRRGPRASRLTGCPSRSLASPRGSRLRCGLAGRVCPPGGNPGKKQASPLTATTLVSEQLRDARQVATCYQS